MKGRREMNTVVGSGDGLAGRIGCLGTGRSPPKRGNGQGRQEEE